MIPQSSVLRRESNARAWLTVASLLMVSAGAGCARSANATPSASRPASEASAVSQTAHNTLTDAERRAGWTLLFDGKSTNGWMSYGGEAITPQWTATEGTLALTGGRGAKDIVTARKYGKYELTLEWRLLPDGPAGNSGIFYNVVDTASAIYWAAPEMAVLDNARHPDGKRELTSSGAVHSMYAVAHSHTKAPGEWNSVRLVVNGDHIEHWLNGTKVVEYELGSADWKTRLAASKFADKPLYGSVREGRIGLQQHGSYVGYRNIKLRELK